MILAFVGGVLFVLLFVLRLALGQLLMSAKAMGKQWGESKKRFSDDRKDVKDLTNNINPIKGDFSEAGLAKQFAVATKLTALATAKTAKTAKEASKTAVKAGKTGVEASRTVGQAHRTARQAKNTAKSTAQAGVNTAKGDAKSAYNSSKQVASGVGGTISEAGHTVHQAGRTAQNAGATAVQGIHAVKKGAFAAIEWSLAGVAWAYFAIILAYLIIKWIIELIKVIIEIIAAIGIPALIALLIGIVVILAAAAYSCIFASGNYGTYSNKSATNTDAQKADNSSDTATLQKWLTHLDNCYTILEKTGQGYDQNGSVDVEIDGTTYKWRPDCSGTVSLYLMSFGEISISTNTEGLTDGKTVTYKTFKLLTCGKGKDLEKIEDLQEGDIIVDADAHTQVIRTYNKTTGEASGYNMGGGASGTEPISKWTATMVATDAGFKTGSSGSHTYDYVIRPPSGGGVSGDWLVINQGDYSDSTTDYHCLESEGSTIKSSGCGTCALATVCEHYTGNTGKYMPREMRDLEKSNISGDSYGPNKNCAVITTIINDVVTDANLTCSSDIHEQIDLDKLDATLAKGGCYIVSFDAFKIDGYYVWTTQGHYVTIIGGNQKDGYYVRDSNGSHETGGGTSGVPDWIPYSTHPFCKEAINQGVDYYYVIEPK